MLTKQEMLNRAVRGLYSQDWHVAATVGGTCLYLMPNGYRCAWGWVDPAGTPGPDEDGKTVGELAAAKIGLAGSLDAAHLDFAEQLQAAHDSAALSYPNTPDNPLGLKRRLITLAECHGLTFPEDCL